MITPSWFEPITTQAEVPLPQARPWYTRTRVLLASGVGLVVFATVLASIVISAIVSRNANVTREGALNQPVRDGEFIFTVTHFECGPTRIGPKGSVRRAKGRFCFVHVSVRNIGDERRAIAGDSQFLVDGEETKRKADPRASRLSQDGGSVLEAIEPGNEAVGILVFDIPKGIPPVVVELHDSAGTPGATVLLA